MEINLEEGKGSVEKGDLNRLLQMANTDDKGNENSGDRDNSDGNEEEEEEDEETKRALKEAAAEFSALSPQSSGDSGSTDGDSSDGDSSGDSSSGASIDDAEYTAMENKRKQLDAELKSKLLDIAKTRAERGRAHVAEYATVSIRDLARLEPRAVLAVCPTFAKEKGEKGEKGEKDEEEALVDVGKRLRAPSFFVYGEKDSYPSAG